MSKLNKIFDQKTAIFRYEAIKAIRNYFDEENFIEIETPCLIAQNTPDPFIDYFQVSGLGEQKYQLHTSPEIGLKKSLGLGLKKIYSVARVFRDDYLDSTHYREFVMLEWYRVGEDLKSLIRDIQEIIARVAEQARKIFPNIITKEQKVTNLSVKEAFWEFAKLDLDKILTNYLQGQENSLTKELLSKGEILPHDSSFYESFSHVMSKYVEPRLPKNRVNILFSWPYVLAALAQNDPQDLRYCQRFEAYWGDLELANAYCENNNPLELRKRFELENIIRRKMGKAQLENSDEFLKDVSNIPDCVGVALGVDRLLMCISQRSHIQEVIFGARD